ncbi:MAG: hypothetical protein AVDCRST_MAG14-2243, partial [uncultured Rubrobacteraceae bacterium]
DRRRKSRKDPGQGRGRLEPGPHARCPAGDGLRDLRPRGRGGLGPGHRRDSGHRRGREGEGRGYRGQGEARHRPLGRLGLTLRRGGLRRDAGEPPTHLRTDVRRERPGPGFRGHRTRRRSRPRKHVRRSPGGRYQGPGRRRRPRDQTPL